MYPVSSEFSNALKRKFEQEFVILLPDGFLVKDNVAMDGGVTFTEILNPDTDYTIGKAVMSSLSVRLVNTGLPDTLYTEEFTASIGAFAGVSTNTTSDYESSIKFLSRGNCMFTYLMPAQGCLRKSKTRQSLHTNFLQRHPYSCLRGTFCIWLLRTARLWMSSEGTKQTIH